MDSLFTKEDFKQKLSELGKENTTDIAIANISYNELNNDIDVVYLDLLDKTDIIEKSGIFQCNPHPSNMPIVVVGKGTHLKETIDKIINTAKNISGDFSEVEVFDVIREIVSLRNKDSLSSNSNTPSASVLLDSIPEINIKEVEEPFNEPRKKGRRNKPWYQGDKFGGNKKRKKGRI